jgi:hypothetical protein
MVSRVNNDACSANGLEISAAAGRLGVATIGLLLVASAAIGLLVPSGWDAFDPDLRVGWAAYAFVVGSGANAVAALIMWFRRASRLTADGAKRSA